MKFKIWAILCCASCGGNMYATDALDTTVDTVVEAPIAVVETPVAEAVEAPAETVETPAAEEQVSTVEMQVQLCREIVQQNAADNADVMAMFDSTVLPWVEYQAKKAPNFNLQGLLNAIAFAAVKHKDQHRKDIAQTPYIIHPMGVAKSLWAEGDVRNANILIAAILHDTVEDTETTFEEIEASFGHRVCYIVAEVTKNPHLTSDEHQQEIIDLAPSMSTDARLVKLADRLYNVRDLKTVNWTQEKIANYREWSKKVLAALKNTNKNLEKALDKEIASQEKPPKPAKEEKVKKDKKDKDKKKDKENDKKDKKEKDKKDKKKDKKEKKS